MGGNDVTQRADGISEKDVMLLRIAHKQQMRK
jgi:hypothetical protein